LIDVLSIDDHLGLSFVVWVFGLFKILLIDVELHIQQRSCLFEAVFSRGDVGVIGFAFEHRRDGIDNEEDDEDVVEVEAGLCLGVLAVLLASEGIAELRGGYVRNWGR
jgi:hypothetical protein